MKQPQNPTPDFSVGVDQTTEIYRKRGHKTPEEALRFDKAQIRNPITDLVGYLKGKMGWARKE